MPKIRVCRSPVFDIFLNLAIEDWLFRILEPDERILFLWRNDPAVVIGRFQNPWLECRVAKIERDGVALARRQSGGGSVWHDRGNLCFTFFGPRESFDRRVNIEAVTTALRGLGVEAEANERLDILVEGHKISGSAFRETANKAFHHGTILVDADLRALSRYLTSKTTAVNAKGIRSIRSTVANVVDYAPDAEIGAIEEALAMVVAGESNIQELNAEEIAKREDVAAYRERLASRSWLFDASPPFTRRLESPNVALTLRIAEGRVAGGEWNAKKGFEAVAEASFEVLRGAAYDETRLAADLRAMSLRTESSVAACISELAAQLAPEDEA